MLKSYTSLRGADSVINVINVLVGLALAASPWVIGHHTVATAQWDALAIGIVIALIGIGALAAFAKWEEMGELSSSAFGSLSPPGRSPSIAPRRRPMSKSSPA